jgi:hypothetical protein
MSVPVLKRIRLSILAVLLGWLASTLVTMPQVWASLWRNAAPGDVAWALAQGSGLWALFTLVACAGLWCAVVLPLAVLVPAKPLVRWRIWLMLIGSGIAVYLVEDRLNVWYSLTHPHASARAPSPLAQPLLWTYSGFGIVFSCVTTLAYARGLRKSARG